MELGISEFILGVFFFFLTPIKKVPSKITAKELVISEELKGVSKFTSVIQEIPRVFRILYQGSL